MENKQPAQPSPDDKASTPFWHNANPNPEEVERIKAEFAAKIKESEKKWPGKRGKRKR